MYFPVILPGKLTENTFSFTATTWGIVTGDEWANCKLGIIRWPWWFEGQIGNWARTPGLTPLSAMGSLMTSESQDTCFKVPSERQHPTQGSVTALGHWDIILDQRKECLLLALQHHFQQHLVSHPGTDQDQPCLASEASQQWYAGWYAAGINIQTLCYETRDSKLSSLEMFLQLDWSPPVVN